MSEDTKKKILDGALQMFTQNGIKSITMDEIAESLSISKRTIYENFKDKSTLVTECLKYMHQTIDQKIKQISRESENTIVDMMETTQEWLSLMKTFNPKFMSDLKNLDIPSEYSRQKEMEIQIRQEMKLTKGQEEGLIRPDISVSIVSSSITDGMKQMIEKSIKDNPNIPAYKIITTFVKIYFRGIATEKGLKIIEEYERSHDTL